MCTASCFLIKETTFVYLLIYFCLFKGLDPVPPCKRIKLPVTQWAELLCIDVPQERNKTMITSLALNLSISLPYFVSYSTPRPFTVKTLFLFSVNFVVSGYLDHQSTWQEEKQSWTHIAA